MVELNASPERVPPFFHARIFQGNGIDIVCVAKRVLAAFGAMNVELALEELVDRVIERECGERGAGNAEALVQVKAAGTFVEKIYLAAAQAVRFRRSRIKKTSRALLISLWHAASIAFRRADRSFRSYANHFRALRTSA